MAHSREFLLSFTLQGLSVVAATVWRADTGLPIRHVETEDFGPFDTHADLHRWMWTQVQLDIARHPD